MSIGPHLKKAENGVYYVHWVEGNRSKRESTRRKELAAAKEYFREWVRAQDEASKPEEPQHLIGTLWAHYRDGHVVPNLPPRSSIAQSWRLLEPFFGQIALADLDQQQIDRFVEQRRQPRVALVGHAMRSLAGAKDSTIRQDLLALSACLNWCADRKRKPRIIEPAEVPVFELPPPGQPRDRWLSMMEMQKLLDAARTVRLTPPSANPTAFRRDPTRLSRAERFLWLGLETGARMMAICELTWDRVDFETGMIDYNVPGRKRTTKRRTAVPMSGALRLMLEQAHQERTTDHVLDNACSIWPAVNEVAVKAGLPGVSPHVLRHTAATHMARRGVPLWLVANVLGNTLAQVERVYAKHCPQAMATAVELISGGTDLRFAPSSTPQVDA